MVLIANIVAALLLMLFCSTLASVTGWDGWGIHAALVVAVYVGLRHRFSDAAWIMLAVAWIADVMAAGPPGLYGLAVTLAFFAVFAFGQRVANRSTLLVLAVAAAASVGLDLGLGLLYRLFHPELLRAPFFSDATLWTAAATALVTLPYQVLAGWLESIWRRRRERSILFQD